MVLDIVLQERRNQAAAEVLLGRLVEGQPTAPRVIVTDKLASYVRRYFRRRRIGRIRASIIGRKTITNRLGSVNEHDDGSSRPLTPNASWNRSARSVSTSALVATCSPHQTVARLWACAALHGINCARLQPDRLAHCPRRSRLRSFASSTSYVYVTVP